ncbi:MAG: multidrug ABC transporter ATP-binding protein [Gammaproteobacteria bacterium]|nr:multidrug ABC transporter ATP-binding protein [Gammaproteobacteria bacterium]MCH2349975.1 ABC transporter ATP-binding protein [Pseudomonadales bacterium]HAO55043.1 multidrug ABC transporter ATP-binding protein [Gammaproteobacteria bacterium]
MIRVEHLTRRYGDVVAAADVNFDVGAGEIVGLLGHNGAGKTTVMKILTGFLEPSSGKAIVDGLDVQHYPSQTRSKLGYLPENLPVYPEMSVVDYLLFAAKLRQVGNQSAEEAVKKAMKETDLVDRAFDTIGTLSRGYRQRVGVAQAILHTPQALILDEPTNGLDPSQTQHMRELIKARAETATVILSTHIMQEVSAVCDRVLIMRDGVLVVDARLEDLQRTNDIELYTSSSIESVQEALRDHAQVKAMGDRLIVTTPNALENKNVDEIASLLVKSGVSIYSLTPEHRSLETLFKEVSEVGNAA